MRRTGLLTALIVALLMQSGGALAQKSTEVSEDYSKAVAIYNFGKYVAWPAAAFAKADSPIVVGVLGDDNFAGVLKENVDGKKIDGRVFLVKRLKWSKDGKDLKDCTILFVAASEASHYDDLIQMTKGSPTLTVADTPAFARRGGMINFILEDSKVHLEINNEAAKQENLIISSRLLSISKIVQPGMAFR